MFHEWIEEELARIEKKDLIEPEYEMDPKTDHPLGEMSEKLKKLFTLWRKTGQATREAKKAATSALVKIMRELPEEPSNTELDEAEKRAQQVESSIRLAKERENLMRQVFWFSLRDEFPGADGESLTVCKGFKVAMSQAVGLIISVKL